MKKKTLKSIGCKTEKIRVYICRLKFKGNTTHITSNFFVNLKSRLQIIIQYQRIKLAVYYRLLQENSILRLKTEACCLGDSLIGNFFK